ncbi:hypothetical protein HGRIS_010154 [Hohenbuehelia grisea]|uniref:tRNA (guanine(9)-N1)-methyltransferase n=1 Tax=Hohenbuehelia grisea TaxID=104357 RepID=A0ABR3J3X8_9AGAR
MQNVPQLSKSAQKKKARQEKYHENKLLRRAREKEQKKEKKRIRAEKRAAGELDEDEDARQRARKRPRVQPNFNGRLVVDLGFDDKMIDKEIISLSSQLAYSYSVNRQAGFPFHLVFSSLTGRLYDRLESVGDAGYKRWSHTEWWTDGYERLWSAVPAPDSDRRVPRDMQAEAATSASAAPPELDPTAEHVGTADLASTSTAPVTDVDASASRASELEASPADADAPPISDDVSKPAESSDALRNSVVYLTADSEYELLELKEDETYIIGGICDHNRYKNLCLEKATATGVRHARLPIGRYLAQLPTRKVLTVNQVVEILARWVETRDWEQALHAVVPKRKFNATGKKGKGAAGADADEGDGDEDAEGEVDDTVPEEGGEGEGELEDQKQATEEASNGADAVDDAEPAAAASAVGTATDKV